LLESHNTHKTEKKITRVAFSTMTIPFQPSDTTRGIYVDRSKMLDDMMAVSRKEQQEQEQSTWRFDLTFLTAPAQKFGRVHYHDNCPSFSSSHDEEQDSLDLAARRLGTTRIKTWQAFEVNSSSLKFDEHQQEEEGEHDQDGGACESMNDDEGFPVIGSTCKRRECTIDMKHDVDPRETSVVGTPDWHDEETTFADVLPKDQD
jgi:hypothetical protein